jgi:hypothetical protein
MFDGTVNQLSRQIAAALETLTFEQGFGWPIFASIIAANGSMIGAHYRVPGEVAHIVAKHVEEPGFGLPINLVFVSGTDGRAANIVIARPDEDDEVHHA